MTRTWSAPLPRAAREDGEGAPAPPGRVDGAAEGEPGEPSLGRAAPLGVPRLDEVEIGQVRDPGHGAHIVTGTFDSTATIARKRRLGSVNDRARHGEETVSTRPLARRGHTGVTRRATLAFHGLADC